MEFAVNGSLTSSETALIVNAGLTFVLYQRGQIPLPYQQLEKSALQFKQEGGDDLSNPHWRLPQDESGGEQHNENEGGVSNPRERISLLVQERRQRTIAQKLEKRRRLALIAEYKAYSAIQPALETLGHLLEAASSINPGHIRKGANLLVILALGPSIYCPKEVFCFDLNPATMTAHGVNAENTVLQSTQQFQNTVIRRFYKALITNADLLDFTSKSLSKTYTHVCVLSSLDKLNSCFAEREQFRSNLIKLPAIPPSLVPLLIGGKSTSIGNSLEGENITRSCPWSRKLQSKCFRIKIGHDETFVEEDSINNTNETCSSNSFSSSDILFDINSFSCYQIPLRFKGVQCKNKM